LNYSSISCKITNTITLLKFVSNRYELTLATN
jgi:DNA-directed RNA polymerase subunit K/omega